MSDTKYCKDCKNINCPENRVSCKYPDAIACNLYRDTPPTFFERITASMEVLADEFVYCAEPERFCECADWRSVILGNVSFATRYEAFAATLEKLKEVGK